MCVGCHRFVGDCGLSQLGRGTSHGLAWGLTLREARGRVLLGLRLGVLSSNEEIVGWVACVLFEGDAVIVKVVLGLLLSPLRLLLLLLGRLLTLKRDGVRKRVKHKITYEWVVVDVLGARVLSLHAGGAGWRRRLRLPIHIHFFCRAIGRQGKTSSDLH